MVEFGILGPVQVFRDGRVLGLGGPRQRALLALLLVARGQVVPAERLAEDLPGAEIDRAICIKLAAGPS